MGTQHEVSVPCHGTARHSIFVIGRIRKGEQKLIFLRPAVRPVFPGPWEIRAILADS